VRSESEASREPALERALSHPTWYHTIDLAPGVTTPGMVDMRPAARKVLPADLSGIRALDVGTFDGFWAFEMERRGADVVAIDIDSYEDTDWPPLQRDELMKQATVPPGEGFRLARAALGSQVERIGVSVYRLDAEAIGGPVDLAIVGALLLHLRDPVAALERVHSVISPGGRIILLEVFRPVFPLLHPRRPAALFEIQSTRFNWWVGNIACLRSFLAVAGFRQARRLGIFRWKAVSWMRQWAVALEARRH
jgi:SAM-dependent methyltransferase